MRGGVAPGPCPGNRETVPFRDRCLTHAVLPGGNGLTFDWRLLVGRKWLKPWMLAGGLTPDNVAQAVRLTGVRQVDVASGVESAPGVKDAGKIAAFVEAAQGVRAGVPILR